MTAITYDNPSAYGRGERQALEWLGRRRSWKRVSVTRRSERPFDMEVKGTRARLAIPGPDETFSCWFVTSALAQFCREGLTVAPFGDLNLLRARPVKQNWMVFENVYRVQANRALMVPMFSGAFLQAVWSTWGAISPDAMVMDNEEAVELVLDADRLTTNVGKWADEEFDAAQEQHGYEKAFAEVCRLCRLV